ncbi:anti-sigma factor domain-containing protein [Tepidibacter hydrothermalis]|uniref:Anti-sigma factor domain-containing protein n=1 Tax=Tepidibacter hydrothermalis TaxID=3036126 RepID=A0ABY8EEY0_9FIRM|nr:anti-sigma factor domain-containing protein [Tepidibacter hydrothermalis]WFD10334.1 anti-sigma factor domain-containing protein [Tepidibacter hydrothermalis]
MIYKGCIIKIEDDFAIVLSNDMEYIKVIKKDGMNIGNQIMFVKDDIYNENKINYKKISALAAVVFILFMSINIFNIKNNENMIAAAVVSLDINPSIEFELNKKGIVIEVNDINEEANKIIDKEVIGKKIEDALYITINNAREKNYISSQKNSVLISDVILDSTVKDKLNIEEDLQVKLNNNKKDNYIKIVYLKSNKNNMKDAHKNDMSIGKYEAFKEIEKKNADTSVYEVKNMKVYQIFDENGKINNDVIEVEQEDNFIEVEKDNVITEKEDSNFENQSQELGDSKELQDNQATEIIKKNYDKDKNKDDDKLKDDNDNKQKQKDKDKEKSKKKDNDRNKEKDKNKNKDRYKKDKGRYKKDKDEDDEEDKDDDYEDEYDGKLKSKIKHSHNEKYKDKKDKYHDKFKKYKPDNKLKHKD